MRAIIRQILCATAAKRDQKELIAPHHWTHQEVRCRVAVFVSGTRAALLSSLERFIALVMSSKQNLEAEEFDAVVPISFKKPP
jgi:hypothetical protein